MVKRHGSQLAAFALGVLVTIGAIALPQIRLTQEGYLPGTKGKPSQVPIRYDGELFLRQGDRVHNWMPIRLYDTAGIGPILALKQELSQMQRSEGKSTKRVLFRYEIVDAWNPWVGIIAPRESASDNRPTPIHATAVLYWIECTKDSVSMDTMRMIRRDLPDGGFSSTVAGPSISRIEVETREYIVEPLMLTNTVYGFNQFDWRVRGSGTVTFTRAYMAGDYNFMPVYDISLSAAWPNRKEGAVEGVGVRETKS